MFIFNYTLIFANKSRVPATTLSWNFVSRTCTEPSIGLPVSSKYIPVWFDLSVNTSVIIRAARFGVLQHLMKGASGLATYFARKRRAIFASLPRLLPGQKPGSTALNRSFGFSRANTKTEASSHCFVVAYASKPRLDEPPDCHSPRALASAEIYRPPRKPTTTEAGSHGRFTLGILDTGAGEHNIRTVWKVWN